MTMQLCMTHDRIATSTKDFILGTLPTLPLPPIKQNSCHSSFSIAKAKTNEMQTKCARKGRGIANQKTKCARNE